jgi:hypothetical protein
MFNTLWKRLTDFYHIKHVNKALTLIDYLLKNGVERFVNDVKLRSDVLLKLCYYKYLKDGRECGVEVRNKATSILELLNDRDALMGSREMAISTKDKIRGFSYKEEIPVPQRRQSVPIAIEERKIMHGDSDDEDSVEEKVVTRPVRSASTPQVVAPKADAYDDLLSFARGVEVSQRMITQHEHKPSGTFMFDFGPQPKGGMIFDQSFNDDSKPCDDVMLFDEVVDMADEEDRDGRIENEEVQMDDESVDMIPDDIWDVAIVDDIRITLSERKRREHAIKKKKMMNGKKLKQMEAKHKMEFDPNVVMPQSQYYGTGSNMALVVYGAPQQQQQMVPYGYARPVEQLHWN